MSQQAENIIGTKKGVSVMIGYILLIALAVVMSVIVYQWLKTYVPKDTAKCPDGVAVFVQKSKYTCTGTGADQRSVKLELTLKNNGRFSIAGYYIHVTDKEDQELAVIDISGKIDSDEGAGDDESGVIFFTEGSENSMPPGDDVKTSVFDLSSQPLYYKVQIIPVRYDKKPLTCGSARVTEVLSCEE